MGTLGLNHCGVMVTAKGFLHVVPCAQFYNTLIRGIILVAYYLIQCNLKPNFNFLRFIINIIYNVVDFISGLSLKPNKTFTI